MPKSRGRKRPKHSPQRRPASPGVVAVRRATRLLDPDITRADAELFASGALGTAPPVPLGADAVQERVVRLIASAAARPGRATAALVRALGLVVDRPEVRTAVEQWAGALSADLTWTSQPPARLVGTSRSADAYDDDAVVFLVWEDLTLAVSTSRSAGDAVVSLTVVDPEMEHSWSWERRPVPPEAAVADVRRALQHTETWWPPHDDEDYLALRALLAARLRAEPAGPEQEDWQPLSDQARQELVDRCVSTLKLPDDEVTRELVDLCLTFGDGYLPGGALMWSPGAVKRFLLDWAPRKTVLDPELRDVLPVVAYAFVGWALIERGVDRPAAAAAAQVALDLREEFLELYDTAERSPATELMARLQAQGTDLGDSEALQAAIAAYNAEQMARKVQR